MAKYRTGFVSNSSSSSFVIIGCALTKQRQAVLAKALGVKNDDDDWMYDENVGKLNLQILNTEDSADGGYVLGEVLADSDEEYMERRTVSFDEMKAVEEKIHGIFGENVPVALHIGTRPT